MVGKEYIKIIYSVGIEMIVLSTGRGPQKSDKEVNFGRVQWFE